MDLFSDFSFATASSSSSSSSSRRSKMYSDFDMEDISPNSSRSSSPVHSYPAPTSAYRSHPVSMAELSANFDRHTIDPDCSPSPLFGRLQHPSSRRRSHAQLAPSSAPSEYYDSVRRSRQSGARGLCSGARLASIETLVDRMLRDGTSCFASLHPSSGGSSSSGSSSRQPSRKSSVTSAPTSMPTPRAPSLSSYDSFEEEEEDFEDGEFFDSGDMVSPAHALVSRARFGGGVAAATSKRRGGIEKSISSRQRRMTIGRTRS
jgi:hypothetical protein